MRQRSTQSKLSQILIVEQTKHLDENLKIHLKDVKCYFSLKMFLNTFDFEKKYLLSSTVQDNIKSI